MIRDISGWTIRLDPEEVAARRAGGVWRGRTIADDARALAEAAPGRTCVRAGDEALTYGEALARAERLAAGLWRLGLRPGDVVSFQLPNWLEAVVVDLAAALLGLVVNPIVPIYRHAEVAQILADCRARAVLVPETDRGFAYGAMMRDLAAGLPDLAHVVVLRGTGGLAGTVAYEDLAAEDGPVPWPAQRPEAVKLVMYTSGTTGRPKGVLHTHETMPRSLRCCVEHWGIAPGDVVLMPSPVTHITGYGWGLEMPFYHGLEAVLMERWQADEAVALIDRHGASVTVGATPFLAELVEAGERAGSRLASLKVFACGGAAVSPGLVRRANGLFARGRACRVYGSTEAPMVTLGFVGPGSADLAADTDGRIVDYAVAVVDEAGAPAAPGREGEILVSGASLFVGYADAAETRAAFTADGRFRMGDIGYLTGEGAVVITGRKKDLIIRGGENISAKEIEDALHRHPAVREAAVVAMPHPRLVETVCAYVIPREGAVPALPALAEHLARLGLARQKVPEHLEIVGAFPRTASGKIRKDVLRAQIAARLAERSGDA
ncbi:Medium-chain fatty-acid--CoA ligase [Methylobacterium crusticola]|uniref:Medium-chain fatty-acid--CoA ligase n=1 Tax=Methylobacterium crusticola TaxID=1697972 RepID=A0ABQ4R3G1_9HYPH|nr:AMP-binding protein [Methylobacterium crusticola]GJD52216.1 Medium-chain fatty-acid--CoA ligase [Methylobacterium crusticola]